MSDNPYTGKNPPYGEDDYAGRNWRAVRAIRDEACRTGGEDGFVIMTRAQADALLDGYAGPTSPADGDVIDEVELLTEDAMWDFMEQFLIKEVDPDDEETEDRIIRALEGPVVDAMVAAAVKDELSPASYDALMRPWRLHCEANGIELP